MTEQPIKKLLNVGGGSKNIEIPNQYDGWTPDLLDIDPKGEPDIICDARELTGLAENEYDGVYCSHNLEHYYHHDAIKVLHGFRHVLKEDGFIHVRVPDIAGLIRIVAEKDMDIEDVLYQSPIGPITVRDVIYGYGVEIEQSGNDFYAHKTGYSQQSLRMLLNQCGFPVTYMVSGNYEINALALMQQPSRAVRTLFKLPD